MFFVLNDQHVTSYGICLVTGILGFLNYTTNNWFIYSPCSGGVQEVWCGQVWHNELIWDAYGPWISRWVCSCIMISICTSWLKARNFGSLEKRTSSITLNHSTHNTYCLSAPLCHQYPVVCKSRCQFLMLFPFFPNQASSWTTIYSSWSSCATQSRTWTSTLTTLSPV